MPEETVEEVGEGLESAFTDAAAAAEATPPEASPSPQAGSADPAPPPEPVEPALSSAFQAAQTAGIDTEGYADDAALIAGMYKQQQESQPYVDYARNMLPYDAQIRQALQPQQQQAQPEPAPEAEWNVANHFQSQWKKPAYDDNWDNVLQSGMIKVDQTTGQYVPAEGYQHTVPLDVLQGLNSHKAWQRDALERMVNDPYQSTWDAFQEPLQRMIDDRVSQTVNQYDDTQNMTGWEARNAQLLYEHDANGQMLNDIYGNPKTTAYGDAFITSAQELRAGGVTDTDTVIRLATQMSQPAYPQQAAPAAPVEQVPEQKASFLKEAMAKASHQPSSGAYAEGGDVDPLVQTQLELDNMFSVGAKAAKLI